jgi:SAM-dependent methyltransferase
MATLTRSPSVRDAVAWYDAHAERLADGYEGLDAALTHPRLFDLLDDAGPLRILDVGAGTGRDAAAFAALGHSVTAVDPSRRMLRVARALHTDANIAWVQDALPALGKVDGPFDLIMLSAVWMHIPREERAGAFARLASLLAPAGRIYMTLRLGADEPERAIWQVDAGEVGALARAHDLTVADLGRRPDLLGRDDVSWQALLVTRA